MTSNPDDLVITGWGAVSPIGIGPEPFWNSLVHGRGAVRMVEPAEAVNGRRWMAGVVEGFEPKQFVQPRKSLKVMCVETQMAFASSVLACQQAGIEPGKIEPDRLGTVFGSEMLLAKWKIFSRLWLCVDQVRRCSIRNGVSRPCPTCTRFGC